MTGPLLASILDGAVTLILYKRDTVIELLLLLLLLLVCATV